jgi:hypothetical protein
MMRVKVECILHVLDLLTIKLEYGWVDRRVTYNLNHEGLETVGEFSIQIVKYILFIISALSIF